MADRLAHVRLMKPLPELWQHHPGSPVHHVSHPDRDAVCGQTWGVDSFIGYTTGWRRCARCRKLGET